jgi:hypothetical protein
MMQIWYYSIRMNQFRGPSCPIHLGTISSNKNNSYLWTTFVNENYELYVNAIFSRICRPKIILFYITGLACCGWPHFQEKCKILICCYVIVIFVACQVCFIKTFFFFSHHLSIFGLYFLKLSSHFQNVAVAGT